MSTTHDYVHANTCLAGDVVADIHLLVVEQHAVDGLDSSLSSFGSLIVDVAVASGTAVLIGRNFAGEDVAESSEGIVKGLRERDEAKSTQKLGQY